MLKTVGLTMIILLSGIIGIDQSVKLSNRAVFLEELSIFISYIKTQIRCSGDNIIDIIFSFNSSSHSQKLSFLTNISLEALDISNFYELWKTSVNKISKSYGLKKDDINLIKKFGCGLGLSDVEGQISHCELYFNLIVQKQTDAIKDKQKKYRLYPILGFSIGICIALVFA